MVPGTESYYMIPYMIPYIRIYHIVCLSIRICHGHSNLSSRDVIRRVECYGGYASHRPSHMDSFFDQDEVDLYAILAVEPTASQEDIKKTYRKLALIYHPDKHAAAAEDAKLAASRKFQQVGFAYAVLSDKKRRAKYDSTGSMEEGFDLAEGEDGWQAYFEALFESVTKEKLDQMKKEYQGF